MSESNNYITSAYKTNNITRMVYLESAGQYPVSPESEMDGSSWNAYAKPSDCGCKTDGEQFGQPGQVGCGCIGMVASSQKEAVIYQVAHAVLSQHLRNFEAKNRRLQKKKPRQYDAIRREIIKMAHIAMCTYLVLEGYSDNGYLAQHEIGQADSFSMFDAIKQGVISVFGITSDDVVPDVPVITPVAQQQLQAQSAAASAFHGDKFLGYVTQASSFGNPPALPRSNYPSVQPSHPSSRGQSSIESFRSTFASMSSFATPLKAAIYAAGPITQENYNIILQQLQTMQKSISARDYQTIASMLSSRLHANPVQSLSGAAQQYVAQFMLPPGDVSPGIADSGLASGQATIANIRDVISDLNMRLAAQTNAKVNIAASAQGGANIVKLQTYLRSLFPQFPGRSADITDVGSFLSAASVRAIPMQELMFIQAVLLGMKGSFSMPAPIAGLQDADVKNIQACLAIAQMAALDEYAVTWLNAATARAPIHENDMNRILALWQNALKRALVPAEISYISALLVPVANAFVAGPLSAISDPTTSPVLAGQLAILANAQIKLNIDTLRQKNALAMQAAESELYANTYAALQAAYVNTEALQQNANNMQLQLAKTAAALAQCKTSYLVARSDLSSKQNKASAAVSAFVNAQNAIKNSIASSDPTVLAAQKQQMDILSAAADAASLEAKTAQTTSDTLYYSYTTGVQSQKLQKSATEAYSDIIENANKATDHMTSMLSSIQDRQTSVNTMLLGIQSDLMMSTNAVSYAQKTVNATVVAIKPAETPAK